ncbi:hypothetical protein E8E11_009365 [Didymella keratinophila]|nr:hypothetical protein E8E11_009365 [Didymella keratinophila]
MVTMSGPTLFEPSGELEHLSEHLDLIPHYLFRIAAPQTRGTTSRSLVQSSAVLNEYTLPDLFDLEIDDAKVMLEGHYLWDNDEWDNLTSWTSSLLFAIQFAIYRSVKDKPLPMPSSIRLYILDTRTLPSGTFFPAFPLIGAFNITNRTIVPKYRHGEYFSQGTVAIREGTMCETTLQELVDHGLYNIFPPFADREEDPEATKLYLRVKELRALDEGLRVPTDEELRIAERIAAKWSRCNKMTAVIMAAMLSLKTRNDSDPAILQAFRENGLGKHITEDSLDSFESTFPTFVPEHRRFVEMMYDLYADAQRQQQDESESLAGALGNLQLTTQRPAVKQPTSSSQPDN